MNIAYPTTCVCTSLVRLGCEAWLYPCKRLPDPAAVAAAAAAYSLALIYFGNFSSLVSLSPLFPLQVATHFCCIYFSARFATRIAQEIDPQYQWSWNNFLAEQTAFAFLHASLAQE